MTYCSQCGAEVNEKAKFCPECGAPIKKREKRAAVVPPVNLPLPKTVHSGARPSKYGMERVEEANSNQGASVSETTKDGKPMPPAGTNVGRGEMTSEQAKQARNNELKAKLVAGLIVAGVLIAVPWMILGYPIWEIFSDGGGGGGGSANFDGTYYGNSYTVTPMGSTSGSGYFTVSNGYVSEGWFQGNVDSSGYFVGTIIVSQGSPAITVTGRFSLTSTFRLSGSNSTGNTSWTLDAYKV